MSDIKQWRVETMLLEDLLPADYNPRKMSTKAREGLGASLEEFGILQPIIYNERSGNIVGGHQRYKHFVESGCKEVDVVVVDLGNVDEIALNLVLNNKEVQGEFTGEVIEMLNVTEVQLGNRFEELGLQDLRESLNFDEPKDESYPTDPKDPSGNSGGGGSGGDGGALTDDSPNAVVTCPHCTSKWRMHSGEVIHDAEA